MLFSRVVAVAFVIAGVTQPAEADQIGPSFDCATARQPLAQILCADPDLSRTDLSFAQAYFALLTQLDDAGKRDLKQEDLRFLDAVQQHCGIPSTGPVPAQADATRKCLKEAYESQRSVWLLRLRSPFSEEANRPIERHLALQRSLQRLGFLPADAKVDGVYGAGTREGISRWQTAHGVSVTGVLGNSDAQALEDQASQRATPASANASAGSKPGATAGMNAQKLFASADKVGPPAEKQAAPETSRGVGNQAASPHEIRVTEDTSSSEPAALAADFLANKGMAKLLIPLGVVNTYDLHVRGLSRDALDAAVKANLITIGNTSMGNFASATPGFEKYKIQMGDATYLDIPYGTYQTTITKTDGFSERLREFKVLLGTWQLRFGPEYQKIARFMPADKIVCKSGDFQMLLSRDSFPGAKWQYETSDIGCIGADLTTHNVNARLPK